MRAAFLFFLAIMHFGLIAQDVALMEDFHFYTNVELTHNGRRHKTYNVADGNYTVFVFESNNAGDPGNGSIANTKLAFQIPDSLKSFSYVDTNLADCGPIYVQFCLCPDEGISIIKKGSISGEKQKDGSWLVRIDVVAFGRKTQRKYQLKRTEVYSMKEL